MSIIFFITCAVCLVIWTIACIMTGRSKIKQKHTIQAILCFTLMAAALIVFAVYALFYFGVFQTETVSRTQEELLAEFGTGTSIDDAEYNEDDAIIMSSISKEAFLDWYENSTYTSYYAVDGYSSIVTTTLCYDYWDGDTGLIKGISVPLPFVNGATKYTFDQTYSYISSVIPELETYSFESMIGSGQISFSSGVNTAEMELECCNAVMSYYLSSLGFSYQDKYIVFDGETLGAAGTNTTDDGDLNYLFAFADYDGMTYIIIVDPITGPDGDCIFDSSGNFIYQQVCLVFPTDYEGMTEDELCSLYEYLTYMGLLEFRTVSY